MPTNGEYQEELRTACEKCMEKYEQDIERISKERDDAREDAKEWHKLYEASLAKQSFNAAFPGYAETVPLGGPPGSSPPR